MIISSITFKTRRKSSKKKKKLSAHGKLCKSHKEKYFFTLMPQHARKEE